MEIEINEEIKLKRFSLELVNEFYKSIHEFEDPSDDYRVRLQNKHKTLKNTEAVIVDAIDNKFLLDGTPDFFIYYREKIAGIFEFAPLQGNLDFVEVGYWLYKPYRRRGILSSIFPTMINYAIEHFDRPRLIATTSLENLPSQKLLEKCSFRNTGKIEEFKKESGVVEKDVEYEIILHDI